jgi:hypothetical protein
MSKPQSKSQNKRKSAQTSEKSVDTTPATPVPLTDTAIPPTKEIPMTTETTQTSDAPATPAPVLVSRNDSKRRSSMIVYTAPGLKGSVRVSKSAFLNSEPPASLDLSGWPVATKTAKAPETKEERKARLAAMPKLTLAEKIAKREEGLAKLKAKAEKDAAKAAAPAPASL